MSHSIGLQIDVLERVLKHREKEKPRRKFGSGYEFMRRSEAELSDGVMHAALETLNWVKDNRPEIAEWIKAGKQKVPKQESAA